MNKYQSSQNVLSPMPLRRFMMKPILPKIVTSKPVVENGFESAFTKLHYDKKRLNAIYDLLPVGIDLNYVLMSCSANPANSSRFVLDIFLHDSILNFD